MVSRWTISWWVTKRSFRSDSQRLHFRAGENRRGLQKGDRLQSALAQAIQQYLRFRDTAGPAAWQRPLDPTIDRLLVATTSTASRVITDTLGALLPKLAKDSSYQPSSQSERTELDALIKILEDAWGSEVSTVPSKGEISEFLRVLRFKVFSFDEPNDEHKQLALSLLKSSVVSDQDQAQSAWTSVYEYCEELNSNRSGSNLPELRTALRAREISLLGTPSFKGDWDRLSGHTKKTLAFLKRHSRIEFRDDEEEPLKIERPIVQEILGICSADTMPLLVLGEPGAGKTGALHDIASELQEAGEQVIFLAIDKVGQQTREEIERVHLGLRHDLAEVLANGPGERAGYFITDALDAARDPRVGRAVIDLITDLKEHAPDWTIVASARTFDARYHTAMRQLFNGRPPMASAASPEAAFREIRHITISPLPVDSLHTLAEEFSPLSSLLELASSEVSFEELLCVPFNLQLAVSLLELGVNEYQLLGIRSQADLLERYWEERLRNDHALQIRDGESQNSAFNRRTILLRSIIEMLRFRWKRTNGC